MNVPPVVDDAQTIGTRLRKLRKSLGMTQTDLAQNVGVTQSAWTQYETGARTISVDVAAIVSRRYGVTLDWIYLGDPAGLPMRLASLLTQ